MKHALMFAALLVSGCGQTKPAGPPIPFDEAGACPFQCCTYREWTVDWDTDLHTDRKDDAPIAFHVALNDTVTALTGVVTTTKPAGPPIPFDEAGACPFQCCTYREWTVDWDTDLHTDRKDDAPMEFHVALNDTVTALTGVVTTTKVGRATATRQVTIGAKHLVVPAGQPIYLLRNVGGGDWKIWVNGVTDEQYIPSQGYCTGDKQSSDECALTVVEQPENVWWAKVRDSRDREGWTREVDHFGNIDACG